MMQYDFDSDNEKGHDSRRAGLGSRLASMVHAEAQRRVGQLPRRLAPSDLHIETHKTNSTVNDFMTEMSPISGTSSRKFGDAVLQDHLEGDNRLETPDEKTFGALWRNSILPTTFHQKELKNEKGEIIGTRNGADLGIGIPALSPSRTILPESFLARPRPKEPFLAYMKERRDRDRHLREQAFGGKGIGFEEFDSWDPSVRAPGSQSRSRAGTPGGGEVLWASRPASKESNSIFSDDFNCSGDMNSVVKRARPQELSLHMSGIADTRTSRSDQRAQARRWLSKTLGGGSESNLRPNTNVINTSSLHTDIMENTIDLCLARQGIGDRLGKQLAQTLEIVPHLIHIDLTENRLTDESLMPIIEAIAKRSDVQSLKLGENKIDAKAAEALKSYIKDDQCRLKTLGLSHADVNDYELISFLRVLEHNQYLTSLDLSRNLIGQKYGQASGVPILAEYLQTHACQLKFLDVSWNFIRGTDAETLGLSLIYNNTLTHLNLTGNMFACSGTQALARGLSESDTLTQLHLGQNNIDSRALFTLLVLIEYRNKSLEKLDLNGNSTLCDRGPAVLMSSMVRMLKRSFDIDIKDCNFTLKDSKCWYDVERPLESLQERNKIQSNPPGFEKFTAFALSNPYDWAVAVHVCMYAADNPNFQLVSAKHSAVDEGELRGTTEIKLERCVDYDEAQMKRVQRVRSQLERSASKMFEKYDVDRSGYIDKEELLKILHDLDVKDLSEEAFEHLIARYDVDSSGVLEENEFNRLVHDLPDDLERRIDRHNYMTVENDVTPFEPPKVGRLFVHARLAPSEGKRITSATCRDVDRILSLSKSCASSSASLACAALPWLSLQVDEATAVVEYLRNELGTLNDALVEVLPAMATPDHARVLVEKFVQSSRQKQILQKTMGSAYWAALGILSYRYKLNMQNLKDQEVLTNLFMYDCHQNRLRKKGDLNDTSQNLNCSNFRNVCFENKSIALREDFFNPLPSRGYIEFDFVSLVDRGETAVPCSDVRFLIHLHRLQWSSTEEEEEILVDINKPINEDEFIMDEYRALKVAECLARENGCAPESIRRAYKPNQTCSRNNPKNEDSSADSNNKETTGVLSEEPKGQCLRPASFKAKFKSATRKLGKAGLLKSKSMWELGKLPEMRAKFSEASTKRAPSTRQQASQMLFQALHACSCRWFTSRQGETMLRRSPLKNAQFTDFEWRESIAILLFNRTVDMENFGLVLNVLNPAEVARVIYRVGWLNIFNPLRPYGHYELMLDRPEERQLCKILMHLNLAEGGKRWQSQRFSWTRQDSDVPAWGLNELWYDERSMPQKGCISFEFVRGGSIKVDLQLRICLCANTRYAPTDGAIVDLGSTEAIGPILTRRLCVNLTRLKELMDNCPRFKLRLEYGNTVDDDDGDVNREK